MTLPRLGTWATAETNYPAGSNPWNSQPVIQTPTADIFTPNLPLPAQYLNYLFNKLFGQDIAIATTGTMASLVTLQAPFAWPVASTGGPYAMCWNDTALSVDATAGQRWLAAAADNTLAHIQVYCGWADANSWQQIGSTITVASSSTPSDLCTDPGGNIYVAFLTGASAINIYQRTPAAPGSFTSYLVLSSLSSATDIKMATPAANIIFFAIGSATSGQAQISGGFGGGFTGLTVSRWIVRTNGSAVLFVPGVAMATPTVYRATGTATYSSAAIGLATTDIPQDLTWSAALGLWVLVAKTAGGSSTIWQSSDGATWTLVQTLQHLPEPILTVVAVGQFLVGALAIASSGNPAQLVSSPDGGVTWYPEPTGTIITSSMFAKLVASPSQILSVGMVVTNSTAVANIRASNLLAGGDQPLT